jgi:hypothetical protein
MTSALSTHGPYLSCRIKYRITSKCRHWNAISSDMHHPWHTAMFWSIMLHYVTLQDIIIIVSLSRQMDYHSACRMQPAKQSVCQPTMSPVWRSSSEGDDSAVILSSPETQAHFLRSFRLYLGIEPSQTSQRLLGQRFVVFSSSIATGPCIIDLIGSVASEWHTGECRCTDKLHRSQTPVLVHLYSFPL